MMWIDLAYDSCCDRITEDMGTVVDDIDDCYFQCEQRADCRRIFFEENQTAKTFAPCYCQGCAQSIILRRVATD